MNRFQFFVFVFLLFPSVLLAQKTEIYTDPEKTYRDALDLFHKEKFSAAQDKFFQLEGMIAVEHSAINADAAYYAAICAFELHNKDAEYLMLKYLKLYPNHSKVKAAWYKLGNYLYYNKRYRRAVKAFEKVNASDLNTYELTEFYFKIGYSYFEMEKFEESKAAFAKVKDKEGEFAAASTYYYGHIAYLENDYETALTAFNKLTGDENFGKIVPYYITQIYYEQKRYEELLQIAPPLLENASSKRVPEIARLIGDSYYRTSQFEKAIPYLEMYQEKTRSRISQEEYYQLGFVYYKAGEFNKAIEAFQKVTYSEDTLSQNAYYHIGDCYVKTNQKEYARTSFASAYKMEFNEEIREDALFNYAKLSYELSLNPYNEAINSFQRYIRDYPGSKKTNEARTFLINMYLETNNYKDALESIEMISDKNDKLEKAYQRILYYRGVELFNTGDFAGASGLFKRSSTMYKDGDIRSKSLYWRGEAFYRLNKTDSALTMYRQFLASPSARMQAEYNMANYNLGYVYFNKKEYQNSLAYYRRFVTNLKKEKPRIANDAYLRIGDCYFISKDYKNAIANYDKAIKINVISTDYALYQKAISLGVLGEFTQKVNMLKSLIEKYSKSQHAVDAKFELANTYQIIHNNEAALTYFNDLAANHPNSSYAKKSLLKIGLIYYNLKNDEKALEVFDRIVKSYPGTPEAREAFNQTKVIYIELGRIDDFMKWTEDIAFASVSDSEQDSITYRAVENKYMEGNCESAISGFANYIQRFPNGFFSLPANYYKAECEFKKQHYAEALKNYEFVIAQAHNDFTEKSLLKASFIEYRNKDYAKALGKYRELERIAEYKNNKLTASLGIMRTNFYLGNYEAAMSSARTVMNTPKVSDEQVHEAHYIIAKSALEIDDISTAQAEFTITSKSKNTSIQAESRYTLAYLQFKLANFAKAEEMIYDFIKKQPSDDYWLAKAFILLSDIYVQKGDSFQAKETLQGVINNYEGAELLKTAHERYNAIVEAEKRAQEKKIEEEIEIDLNSENDMFNEFDQETE